MDVVTGDRESDPPRLALNAREAAAALSISARSLWLLTNQRAIPHVRLGGRIVYPIDLLRTWLAENAAGGGTP